MTDQPSTASRWRKKPVVIEAIRYLPPSNCYAVAKFTGDDQHFDISEHGRCGEDTWIIPTLEGDMEASPGDWIIRGVAGELYPCKPDIFEATYEPAPSESRTATP